VKTSAKKATKTTGKASAKAAAPAKKVSAKSPVKAKAPVKPAAKASKTAKVAAKPLVKATAKASKPTQAKPAAKVAAKTAAKAVVKKATVKAAPSKKAVVSKAPVKKAASKAVVAPKAPAKKASVAQPAAAAKKPAPSRQAAPAQPKVAAKKAPSAAPRPAKQAPAVQAKPDVAPVVAPAAVAAPAADLPARSSRPSARLAQITVPSMPQAVASTAAKASFLPQMTTTVLPVAAAPSKKDPKLANNWKNKSVEQLSDAEVLAMPDDEYMNDVQMAFFRLKLVQLKQDILSNAGETTEHLREDTVVVPDPADRATIEEEHALELRTRDRERKLLKKIEQSIARIDAGDYGYCDETGEPIGVGRLLARPTATLSLEAQQRRELKQKMFGD
jgi:DnaK suppressor protein